MSTFVVLSPAEVRFLTKYETWAKKANLAEKLESLFLEAKNLGSFADQAAVDATMHPGFTTDMGYAIGDFVPGDLYYDQGSGKLAVNTATVVGPATWVNI